MDLTGIRAIGIDEIHWQHGANFLTLVYQIDPTRKRLLWIGLQVRPYEYSFTVTPPQTKNISVIYMAPDERTVKTSVNPAMFSKYFPDISSERFDTDPSQGGAGRPDLR